MHPLKTQSVSVCVWFFHHYFRRIDSKNACSFSILQQASQNQICLRPREIEIERDGGVRMVRLDSGAAARDLRYHHTTSQSCAPASTAPFDAPLSHDLHHHRCHQRYRPRNCSVFVTLSNKTLVFVVSFFLLWFGFQLLTEHRIASVRVMAAFSASISQNCF